MRQNKGISTLSIPIPLVVMTIVLLIVRVALTAYEKFNPPTAQVAIQWLTPDALAGARAMDRIILYDFTADWCIPCHMLEKGPFQTREVIDFINANFIPVRVVDRQREDGVNDDLVTDLQTKFNVEGFPTLVAALPDGAEIKRDSGFLSPTKTLAYLKECVRKAELTRAFEMIKRGEYKMAAAAMQQLSSTLTQGREPIRAVLYGAIAFQHTGDDAGANALLGTPDRRPIDKFLWPHSCISYLRGEIDSNKLLKEAGIERSQETEARYVIAAKLIHENNPEEASRYLRWIKENGDEQHVSYELAIQELKLLNLNRR